LTTCACTETSSAETGSSRTRKRGFVASARAWWLFRVFGHPDVLVLDGGLEKWRAEGRPVSEEPVIPKERHFTARQNHLLVRDLDQIRANLVSHREQVVDARAKGRFAGIEPEPRAGLRAGHIPNSANLPHADLVSQSDGTLLPRDALRRRFEEAGLDLARPIVTTCGSGVSAATLALALYQLGQSEVSVYDGSWSEWGGRDDTPIER
jgi:thiosulfate/3-mercaptopyruvate sulfurtransferase